MRRDSSRAKVLRKALIECLKKPEPHGGYHKALARACTQWRDLTGRFYANRRLRRALKRSTFLGGPIGFGSSFDLFHLMDQTQGLAENPANFHNLFDKTVNRTNVDLPRFKSGPAANARTLQSLGSLEETMISASYYERRSGRRSRCRDDGRRIVQPLFRVHSIIAVRHRQSYQS